MKTSGIKFWSMGRINCSSADASAGPDFKFEVQKAARLTRQVEASGYPEPIHAPPAPFLNFRQ